MRQGKKNNTNKALFIERMMAYLIDMIIVFIITSLVNYPFVDSKKMEDLNNESMELVEKYTNNKLEMEEFTTQYINLYYRIARNSGISYLISIFVGVCYFVVYQVYHNGQTIGKRLLKIRVVSDEDNLSMNQMIFRSFLANSLLVDISIFVFMLFSSKYVYFYSSAILELLQYLMIFISVLMIAYSKDGCAIHDKLVHTKVVRER